MNRWIKLGIVLAGYVFAAIVTGAILALYDRRFTAADNQSMGGMIAGGEMMLGAALFLVLSLMPTAFALHQVRHHRRFWSALAGAGLTFAVAGLIAVLAMLVMRVTPARPPVPMFLVLLGLVQMLGSPLWALGFALFAVLAPERELRRRMLVALAVEIVIAGCGVIWFLSPKV